MSNHIETQQPLVLRDDANRKLVMQARATELREDALASAALIGKITTADQNAVAVQAQQKIHDLLSVLEKVRTEVKKPVLEFGRHIDSVVAEFSKPLKEEQLRLGGHASDFQQLEQARIRAAQQAENNRLLELERQRAKEMATAETHEQADAVQQKYNDIAQQQAPAPIAPIRAQGQRVVEDYEIEVTDIHLLAKAHPTCVNIEPRVSDIKALIKAGVNVSGIKWKKVTNAGVVASRRPAAINI